MMLNTAVHHITRSFHRSQVPLILRSRRMMSSMTSIPYLNGEYLYVKGDDKLYNGPSSQRFYPNKAIISELIQQQARAIDSIVPWFLNNMPESYFHQVPEEFRQDHIKAISAVKGANLELHLNLKTNLKDGRLVLTYIRPGNKPGSLHRLLKDMLWNHNKDGYKPLSRVQVFSTKDESMTMSIFIYGDENSDILDDAKATGQHILKYAEQIRTGKKMSLPNSSLTEDLLEHEHIASYLNKCSTHYTTKSIPQQFLQQMLLFHKVSGTEDMEVMIEKCDHEDGSFFVDVAVANSLPQVVLENASRLLYSHKLDVLRANLDIINDGDNGNVCMLHMLVSPFEAGSFDHESPMKLAKELKRTKWLDPVVMDLAFERYPWLGLDRSEIVAALSSLLHPILSKQNSFAFSKGNIFDTLTHPRNIKYSSMIADLFLQRFDPANNLSGPKFTEVCEYIQEAITSDVEDSVAQTALMKMLEIVKNTLKTNAFLENRYGLSLRLHPNIMMTDKDKDELPYGVIFSYGRRFKGFHVRFQDIARGGLRIVTPTSPEAHALESARHFDECYSLAFAQDLKNKDIPEGGSKGVVLIDTHGLSKQGQNFVMRKSIKGFCDTMLDLVVANDETRSNIVDLFGKKEILFLGPDEQVTVSDINWIVDRARKRGLDNPNTFMSSKPKSGFNHKEYGVTSEGLNVYLDVALRRVLGIDPKRDSFTVKITGGPDGDVAGNLIKILLREYGENVKIVGVADQSGCAECPKGLDHEELLRLVNTGSVILSFDRNRLGHQGILHDATTESGLKARNTMHNRVMSDAFIPAGGRPNTINLSNYKRFLNEAGSPSSKLIVEGANLFLTADARQALYDEAGVVIIKDSSANKCGVITSSYEICAAMLLSEDEFSQNKDRLIHEVLQKLRDYARKEANILFREQDHSGLAIPVISTKLSKTINMVADSLVDHLNDMSEAERCSLLLTFLDHLPRTLADVALDRLERMPEQYVENAIASTIASRIVYQEGIAWVNSLPKKKLAAVAIDYIKKEQKIDDLRTAIEKVELPESQKNILVRILAAGGTRTALNFNISL